MTHRKHASSRKITNNSYIDYYPKSSKLQSVYETDDDDDEDRPTSVTSSQITDSESSTYEPKSKFSPITDSPKPIEQNGPYMNIAPFPVFRGTADECPVTHLSRFSKVCRANNILGVEMMMRIFPVTLDKEAALWYDLNVDPYPSLSWEEIKSSFLEAFQRIDYEEHLRSELMTINQGENESVRSYFLRLQWILKRWPDHGMEDSLLKGVFIDGLREEFKDWIIPQKPSSLDDALRLAFTWEQVRTLRGVRRNDYENKCGFCGGGAHEEKDCEVRERLRDWWINAKEKQDGDSDEEEEIESSDEDEFPAPAGDGRRVHEVMQRRKGLVSSDKQGGCRSSRHHQRGNKRLDRNPSVAATVDSSKVT